MEFEEIINGLEADFTSAVEVSRMLHQLEPSKSEKDCMVKFLKKCLTETTYSQLSNPEKLVFTRLTLVVTKNEP